MKKSLIIFFLSAALAFAAGFYFKDNIISFYNSFGKNLQKIEKTKAGDILNEIRQEVVTPSPLNVGGNENNVVLTRAKIIAQTNVERYDNGMLPPLIENAKLDATARAKAEDMFFNQYFEHVSPSGVGPGDLAKSFGYDYILEGENLILGNFADEKEVLQDWMNSPGHRANILNNRFVDIGAAVIKGTYKGQTVWIGVQEFGLPLSACSMPSADLKNQISSDKSQLDELSLQIDSKKNEIDNTDRSSPQYNQLVDEYNQMVNQYNSLNQEIKGIILQYNNEVNNFNQCVSGSK